MVQNSTSHSHANVASEANIQRESKINKDFRNNSPAVEVALDIARRGFIATPPVVFIAYLFGGFSAAGSLFLGIVIILINFLAAAYILAWASKSGHSLVASMSISGYFIRSSFIAAIVWFVKDFEWVNLILLSITLIFTHLGLLFWELQYVSSMLAYPGLKPKVSGVKPAAGYKRKSF